MEQLTSERPQKKVLRLARKFRKPVGGAALAVFFLGGAFLGGVFYQRHQPAADSNSTSQVPSFTPSGNGGGARFQASRRVMGQVTAISNSSISVQTQSGATTTLSITNSTTITNNGQTAKVSAIVVGDTVFITEDANDTSQAARIMLNPSFGGQGMSQTNAQTQSD